MSWRDAVPLTLLIAYLLFWVWFVTDTAMEAKKEVQLERGAMDALLDREFTRVFGCPLRDKGDGCKPR